MIGRGLVVLLMLAITTAQAEDESARDRIEQNPLVGTWNLVRYAETPEGGEPAQLFGESPIGQFIFTGDGHMSVHIMRNPPNPEDAVVDPDPDACVPGWYCAYFGTYTVDAGGRYWVTHVDGGNIPTYIGTDQKRIFTIDSDRLVISEKYISEGVPVSAERVLIRSHGTRK